MAALRQHDEPVPWLAVLETEADGTCLATSAPIVGAPDPAFFDTDTFAGDPPLGDLLSWMEESHVLQLWVHPSYILAHELLPAQHSWDWLGAALGGEWQFNGQDERAKGWITCWHRGVYGKRAIYLPSLDERAIGHLWCEATDGRTLLEAILRYNTALGRPYAKSPAATGRALLRTLHQAHPHWLQGQPPAISPAKEHTERRYDWARPLVESERHATVLVSYDKNAMYLGACSSVECGYDEPTHLPELSVVDDRCGLPGYFRITWERPISPLPPVITGKREADGTIWVSQPTLTLAVAQREVFSIEEAYIWPRHHRILQPFYARLRDARACLKTQAGPAAGIAAAVVKMTYAQTLGQLDGHWLRDGAEGLYRPHWRHAVMAQARTNLYRALAKVYQATWLAPVAVIEDAAYYLVTDAQEAILRGVMPLDDSLGGFKLQDRVASPTAIVEAIEAAPLGGELRAFSRALAVAED